MLFVCFHLDNFIQPCKIYYIQKKQIIKETHCYLKDMSLKYDNNNFKLCNYFSHYKKYLFDLLHMFKYLNPIIPKLYKFIIPK